MDFLIDRKTYNAVLKEVSPKTALKIRDYLKKKKDEAEPRLKKEFLMRLSINNDEIESGFFEKKFKNSSQMQMMKTQYKEIEKAILKVLIENQGLSEKIKYKYPKKKPEFIIEQYSETISFDDINWSKTEKGFVYFVRNQDIYKIGITDNLLRRFNQLKPDEILNVVRCSNYENLEKQLHKTFKEYRIPQTEYFRLDKNQIEQVNVEMTKGADF